MNTVFECVKWAAYLSPEGAPKEGERPVAFIAVLAGKLIKKLDMKQMLEKVRRHYN